MSVHNNRSNARPGSLAVYSSVKIHKKAYKVTVLLFFVVFSCVSPFTKLLLNILHMGFIHYFCENSNFSLKFSDFQISSFGGVYRKLSGETFDR